MSGLKEAVSNNMPYVYLYTLLVPLETNASLHSFAGLFYRLFLLLSLDRRRNAPTEFEITRPSSYHL